MIPRWIDDLEAPVEILDPADTATYRKPATSLSTLPDEDVVARAEDEHPTELLRAGDGAAFERYWTLEGGLARWSTHPHPWTTLRDLLLRHPGIRDVEGLATHYYHKVFHRWPNAKGRKRTRKKVAKP